MARSPIHEGVRPGKPFGRQAVWEAIRARRDSFALDDLAKATRQPADTIRTYLGCLKKGGYIACAGTLPAKSGMVGVRAGAQFAVKLWRLVRDTGAEAPRLRRDGTQLPVTVRELMWRAMRMLKGDWTWRDLAIAASVDDQVVSEVDSQDYCKHLLSAGYLVVTHEATRGGKLGRLGAPNRLRLVRNTGPRPPMVQRLQTVFDPNLGKVMWQEAPHDD
ncbi:putative phage-related conserved protein [Magnetospirillum sp. XM-1]|uniref:hypothetical protein n=1 Tax=Magnetospirillum sp. XM-1 TaxID=1663591 RepID=UPI00073DF29C|nr:hypothetical protein [Magnetospirillum sp. XM-1]CUW41103.1 putative phage-related conserved protein [Magnetospirillum sp. XM-1]